MSRRGVDPLTVGELLRELEALLRDRPEARDWLVVAGAQHGTGRQILLPVLQEHGYSHVNRVALWLTGDGKLPPLRRLDGEDEENE